MESGEEEGLRGDSEGVSQHGVGWGVHLLLQRAGKQSGMGTGGDEITANVRCLQCIHQLAAIQVGKMCMGETEAQFDSGSNEEVVMG